MQEAGRLTKPRGLEAVKGAAPLAYRGALRGVSYLDEDRLRKALDLKAVAIGPGQYLVESSEEDGEYVDLIDPQIDPRCHCRDNLYRAHELGTPCKHLLAALLEHGDKAVLEAAQALLAV